MDTLSIQMVFVLSVLTLLITVLIWDKYKPSIVFTSAAGLLVIGGNLDLHDYISGLSNTSILSIFLLIIITSSINSHFSISGFFDKYFKEVKTVRSFLLKMGVSVAAVSSTMNNTPVVAIMIPYVYKWGRRNNVNPSKLLIPLSFAAILGGVITIIGTSTNLVLNGLLETNGVEPLGLSDFFTPGVFIACGGILFLCLIPPLFLGSGKDALANFEENKREYLVETRVSANSPIVNKSILTARLRNLEGVFLTEIIRDNHHITPVGPEELIKKDDILLFAGQTDQVLDLVKKIKGLELSSEKESEVKGSTRISEAVISQNSRLERRSAKDIRFREKYDAAIIGIHRKGEKLSGKIGSVKFRAGDLLLLSTGVDFDNINSRLADLIVVNKSITMQKKSKVSRWIFLVSLLVTVILALAGVLELFEAIMMVALMQFFTGMLNIEMVKNAINLDLLLILLASLAIGNTLISSGAAEYISGYIFKNAISWSPLLTISVVFGLTFILTSFINNVAAISIAFPIVFGLSEFSMVPANLLYLSAAFAASCCFATPFAYQTNLMVTELGNYRFRDFFKIGFPLSLLYYGLFMLYIILNYNL